MPAPYKAIFIFPTIVKAEGLAILDDPFTYSSS
jgi:hypothetical protein